MISSHFRIRAGHKHALARVQYRSSTPQSVWASSQLARDIIALHKLTTMLDEPEPASHGVHHYVWKCEHAHHCPPQLKTVQARVGIFCGARQVSVSGTIPSL